MKGSSAVAVLSALVALGAVAAWALHERGTEAEEARVVPVAMSRYAFEPGTSEDIVARPGEVLVFRLTSADVTHGFAIEGLLAGVEVPAGETVDVRVRVPERAGTFTIYCTVFCGAGHPAHKGTLVVAG